MKNSTPKYIASVVVFLVFLALFLFSTFPTEALRSRIVYEIERSSKLGADVKHVSISPLLTLKLKEVTLSRGKDDFTIYIDTLRISPSVLSLVFDNKRIPFTAEIGGGTIKGRLIYSASNRSLGSLRLNISNVHTEILKDIFKHKKNVPEFDGLVSGKLKLDFKNGSYEEVVGSFDFSSDELTVANISYEGFELPEYKGLKANLGGKIEKDITYIDTLQFKNDDFNLMLKGTMPPPWMLRQGGKLDLAVNLILSSDKAKLSFLQAFMNKGNDGTLTAKIAGTVNDPQFLKDDKL